MRAVIYRVFDCLFLHDGSFLQAEDILPVTGLVNLMRSVQIIILFAHRPFHGLVTARLVFFVESLN